MDVGHFYHHHTNSKTLEEHFYFPGHCCSKIYTARFCYMTQDGYVHFPQNYYCCVTPLNYSKSRTVKVEQCRLADEGETDKGSADQDFVGERVNHSAELAGDAEPACDGSIDHVGQACNYEQDEGNIEEPPLLLGGNLRKPEYHYQYNDCQNEPAAGKNVRYLVEQSP